MNPPRIFCVANQKGGVGKTTTTVNLAAGLARIGQRVLVVDLDPQGNATMGSGVDKRTLELSVYDVLLEPALLKDARNRSPKGGYDVLGANRELAGAEIELVAQSQRERRLRQALDHVAADYDFVLIDCPPSLSLLTLNGLCAAHGVIVPMQCEYFALEGLSDLVNTIRQVHANLNPQLWTARRHLRPLQQGRPGLCRIRPGDGATAGASHPQHRVTSVVPAKA